MKKFLVEDVKVGVTDGGFACGPVSGNVVAEVCLRNREETSVGYHCLAEVDGTLNFYETEESIYDILVTENDDEWNKVSACEVGGYCSNEDFFADLEALTDRDEDHALIWKYLVYMIRADWDEIERMKKESIGKCFGDFEVPVSDMEKEYLDENSDDTFEES